MFGRRSHAAESHSIETVPINPDSKPDEAKTPPSWLWLWLGMLALVLVFEVVFVIVLGQVGWNATTVILAGIASSLPFTVGLFLIFQRGRKLWILLLLISTACLSGLIAFALQPLVEAKRARSVSIAIHAASTSRGIRSDSIVASQLAVYGRDYEDFNKIGFQNDQSEFPGWMLPLAGKLRNIPRDDALEYVDVTSDAMTKLVCDSADDLPNLRMLSANYLSRNGLRYLSDHSTDFEKLDAFIFMNTYFPDGCLEKLTRCRLLCLFRSNTEKVPSQSQLDEIVSLPNLEYLSFGYTIDDSVLKRMSECRSLKQLIIYNGDVSPDAAAAFREARPDCKLRIDPF